MVSVTLVVPACTNLIIHPYPQHLLMFDNYLQISPRCGDFLEIPGFFADLRCSKYLGTCATSPSGGAGWPQFDSGPLTLNKWWNDCDGLDSHRLSSRLSSRLSYIDYHLDYYGVIWGYYYHQMIWTTWNGNHQADPEMLHSFGLVLYLTMRDPEMSSEDQNQFVQLQHRPNR